MIYLFLAEGFEEIEALATADILRRGGLEVKTVGVTGKTVCGSHGIPVTADILTGEIIYNDIEAIVLPGGQPGTENLYASEQVRSCVEYCMDNSLLVCAICAAPTVLGRMGLLDGKKAVCYPGCESQLGNAEYLPSESVCIDGNIITGKGPGKTFDFAFAIVEHFKDRQTAEDVGAAMQCR